MVLSVPREHIDELHQRLDQTARTLRSALEDDRGPATDD